MKKTIITIITLAFLASSCGVSRQLSINDNSELTDNDFWAEEFIAEVFFANRTEESPRVYLLRSTHLSISDFLPSDHRGSFERVDSLVREEYRVPGSDELFVSGVNEWLSMRDRSYQWNENAPVFQQPKFKNVIFLDFDDFYNLPRASRRITLYRPVLSTNGNYALIKITTSGCGRLEQNWNWRRPFRIEYRYYCGSSSREYIYQQVEGKWIRFHSQNLTHGHGLFSYSRIIFSRRSRRVDR